MLRRMTYIDMYKKFFFIFTEQNKVVRINLIFLSEIHFMKDSVIKMHFF